MSGGQSSVPAGLLVALQRDIAPVARPFAELGVAHGFSEEQVLTYARGLLESGVARRFGAVFNGRSLGYESTLCAVDVPAEPDRAAALLESHLGITHCYLRSGRPNLWFTLTAPAARLAEELAKVAELLRPHALHALRSVRSFKIQAVFGGVDAVVPGGGGASSSSRNETVTRVPFDPLSRAIVRALQGTLPLCSEPFDGVARALHVDECDLLERLRDWRESGVVRRIGLVMRHQSLGFAANCLCVWEVPAATMESAGAAVAASAHVSHCYERTAWPGFPYNLFAMFHARSKAEVLAACESVTAQAGLPPARMLWTEQEYKKTSPVFFAAGRPPE